MHRFHTKYRPCFTILLANKFHTTPVVEWFTQNSVSRFQLATAVRLPRTMFVFHSPKLANNHAPDLSITVCCHCPATIALVCNRKQLTQEKPSIFPALCSVAVPRGASHESSNEPPAFSHPHSPLPPGNFTLRARCKQDDPINTTTKLHRSHHDHSTQLYHHTHTHTHTHTHIHSHI